MACGLRCQFGVIYLAFLSVGTSCGWFVVNGLYNLIANEPEIGEGGALIGEINRVGAITGLVLCAMFALYPMLCRKISKRVEVWGSSFLIVLSLVSLILLAVAWEKRTIILLCGVIGGAVGNGSILLLFPLISTNYSGWLVAPIRAGTDLSSMISAFLAEAQSPDGVRHFYPTWLLFTFYAAISCCGLVAWSLILKYGIGLRLSSEELEKPEVDIESESTSIESMHDADKPCGSCLKQMILDSLQSFFCPRELLAPVVLAALTQITQWSIAASLGEIGAEMTDSTSCGGEEGRFVFRLSLTLSQILVPLGSLMSSLASCPRWLFYIICLLQYLSCASICTAAAGLWRAQWTSKAGRVLFIASFALCGMLEGYVITMAYRYIGDAHSVPIAKRHSAGALLSVATVILVSVTAWILGGAVSSGQISCADPH